MAFEPADFLEYAFRFARSRCFSFEEAEDAAQEIMLRVWASRARIAEAENPGAYVTGIAKRVCADSARKLLRPRVCMAHGALPDDGEREAEYAALRLKIADLTREYRQLIVGHYFEGRGIRELAELTGMPEGTVKWRLSSARAQIREEWNTMPNTPISPARIEIQLSGSLAGRDIIPELTTPTRCLILRALQTPMSAPRLAEVLGIPTMLAEEELDGLARLQAVERREDGKYQTTFFIEPLAYRRALRGLAKRAADGMRETLFAEMEAMKGDMLAIGFSLGGQSYERARGTLFVHLLHDGYSFWEPAWQCYAPPLRPDGGRYYFMAGEYGSAPDGLRVSDWYGGIPGLEYRTCAPGGASVMARIGAGAERVARLCAEVKEKGESSASREDIATLIEAGALRRESGALAVAVPWFTRAQFEAFELMGKRLLQSVSGDMRAFGIEAEELLKLYMPSQLSGQRPLHVIWAVFELMAELMEAAWPEDAPAAAGLIFVEE